MGTGGFTFRSGITILCYMNMDIGECIGRLEGYGYAVSELVSRRMGPRYTYMDGHGMRIGLSVDPETGVVIGIDCYRLNGKNVDCLLGTTSVYPESSIKRIWAAGIGMDDMFSVLSEPGKAVMRFGSMRLEEELGVLEG